MKRNLRYRCLAVYAAAGLGLMAGRAALGDVLHGARDVLTPFTPGTSDNVAITISIHSELYSLTDDITIIFNFLTASVGGVGYVEPSSTPGSSLVTTIYGDLLSDSPFSIGGLDPIAPDFSIEGNETIYAGGLPFTSYIRESPTKQSLGIAHPDWDLSMFGGAAGNEFIMFQTLVPTSAVPEPTSLALLAGSAGLLVLRRRRLT